MTTRTVDLAVAAPAGPRTRFGRAPLLVVLTGTFMTFLDFFIVNVALPSIQGRLHAGPAAIQLVVAGFGLAFAAGMISGGRLGDLYGRRRMFTVGLALFTVTSAACGLAPTAGFLDVARVLQGGAAAMMTPQVLAILGTIYTGPRRAKAFAAYGMTMGIAGVGGQLIGGALIALNPAGAGWRSIFLINVPVGITALALVPRILPESRGERARVDLVGTALITAALTAIVLPLVEGRQQGWPVWTVLCLAVAPVLLAVFVAHQRARRAGGRAPLVRLDLFRDRAFSVGTLTGIAFAAVPASFFFVLALYLQDGRGLSPLVSGVLTTGQQVGGALGIAVIGVVFFGAAGAGIAHAFAVSLVVLAALTVATAALVQLLPRPGPAS
jgi:MFS family permease